MAVRPSSKDPALRLLFVAADEAGVSDVVEPFRAAGYEPQAGRARDAEELRAMLAAQTWDAIICANGIPGLSSLAALRQMQDTKLDLPFLVLSATGEEKSAIRAMKAGAHDCVARDRMERLVPAVEREVREARHRADHRAALEMLRDSESHFRALASNLPGMVFHLVRDADGGLRFLFVSEGCRVFGFKQPELLASAGRFLDALQADDR